MKKNLPMIIRVLISALFVLSAIAKLYPIPLFGYSEGITKVFEQGQLIPLGFSEGLAPYISRFIIAIEFFIAFAILQNNYLRKVILPLSLIILVIFSLHLSYSIFLGDNENCGCFGELIPMSPLQALIKNIITIAALAFVYKNTKVTNKNSCAKLSIQFLFILFLMFALLPVQTGGTNKRVSVFSEYVDDNLIDINEGKKVLCFFDAGCEHCMDAAKSLTALSDSIINFPKIHIIFSDTEKEKIPEFFDYAGKEYSYQVLAFASYLEVLGYDYDNPAVIYLDNGNQMRFYEGAGVNAFKAEEFKKLFQ